MQEESRYHYIQAMIKVGIDLCHGKLLLREVA